MGRSVGDACIEKRLTIIILPGIINHCVLLESMNSEKMLLMR